MRITKLVLSLCAVVMLAGCSNSTHGVRDDVRDFLHWTHNEPSHMEKNWGPYPTGYYGQHKRAPLLKPPATQDSPVWNEVGAPPVVTGVDTGDVTVYPIDGGQQSVVQYADNDYVPAQTATFDYGQLMQQLYFDHGSAAISKADRRQLTTWGKSVAGKDGLAVTVVGNASLRVDGVTDPVRRKEINFEMAQKRANAVTNVLQKAGLTRGWIEAVSRGEEDATGNEANDRRADVYMR